MASLGPRSRRRIVALAAALIVVAAVVAALAIARPGSNERSGPVELDRATCIYSRNEVTALTQIERATGRTYDCVELFNDAAPNWKAVANPWFLVKKHDRRYTWTRWQRRDKKHRVILTQGMVPGDAPADWRQRGARGEYDRHFTTLARGLVRRGMGSAVIRLGHEANGTWYKHSVGDTPKDHRAWAKYWARIARAMNDIPGADFTFDWNISAGYRAIPFDQYYPGDDVVDIVGIDAYDYGYPGVNVPGEAGEARFKAQYEMPGGLRDATAFASKHDKPTSIPEWGLAKPGRTGGVGDNPDFIDRIADYVAANDVAYTSYFMAPANDTLVLTDAPKSLAAYKTRFGGS